MRGRFEKLRLLGAPYYMPAWHVRMVPKDQLQIPSAGSNAIVFVNDGIELYRIRLWAELDPPKTW